MEKYYKWLATLLVMIGIFMTLLDTTIVDISLPKMMAELDADTTGIQWVIITYLLSSAIGMSIIGWLGERVSSRTIYLVGLAIFTGCSFLCGQAANLAQMNTFRLLQGIGGGLIVPIGMVILYEVFPEEELGLAMGVYGFGAALAPAMGPTIGGFVTEALHWRWIFYINVPLGIIGFFFSYLFLREKRKEKVQGGRFDVLGFLFMTIMLSSLILFLAKGQEKEWFQSDFILYMFITFLISVPLFILWELRVKEPFMDIRIFRSNPFSLSIISFALASAAIYGSFIMLPLYLQRLRLYPTLTSGLIMLPGGIVCALALMASGVLADKTSPKYGLVWGGLVLMSLSHLLLSHLDLYTSKWAIAFIYWIPINIAWGFTFASANTIALGSVSEDKVTTASSIANVTLQMAGCIGTAIAITNLERGTSYYFEALASRLTYENAFALATIQKFIAYLTQKGIPPEFAMTKGKAFMELYVTAYATAYAFQWVFLFIAILLAIGAPIGFFIRYKKKGVVSPNHC